MQVGWPEILALAVQCRFNNCLHLREPGCAVTAAVAAKRIAPRRYEATKRLINIIRGLPPEYGETQMRVWALARQGVSPR